MLYRLLLQNTIKSLLEKMSLIWYVGQKGWKAEILRSVIALLIRLFLLPLTRAEWVTIKELSSVNNH